MQAIRHFGEQRFAVDIGGGDLFGQGTAHIRCVGKKRHRWICQASAARIFFRRWRQGEVAYPHRQPVELKIDAVNQRA